MVEDDDQPETEEIWMGVDENDGATDEDLELFYSYDLEFYEEWWNESN